MSLLRVDSENSGLVIHNSVQNVDACLSRLARGHGPVIIMIHGYKFQPGDPTHCPHQHILSLRENPCRKAVSWPRLLGFDNEAGGEGLAIAFGWNARGTVWQAWQSALNAAQNLAGLIRRLKTLAPHRRVHTIAHSMGARVVLNALPDLPAHALDRTVLLAGAEFLRNAERTLASPAGQSCEVINIVSRENDLFDLGLEWLITGESCSTTIGRGFPDAPNALTVQIDDDDTLTALRRLGFPIAATERRICHWSAYLRPGVFDFYQTLFREPQRMPLRVLKSQLPQDPHPRWSRLLAVPRWRLPLPMPSKASS